MLLTLSTLALADAALEAPECEMVFVHDAVPAAEQQGVPVDIQPVVFFEGDCDGPSIWTIELEAAGEIVASQDIEFDFSAPTRMARLEHDAQLAPDSYHLLRVRPGDEGWGETVEFGFWTGTGRVEGSAAPRITAIDAWTFDGRNVSAWVDVTPGQDPDDTSVVLVASEGGALSAAPGRSPSSLAWNGAIDGDELCLAATQEDGIGRAVDSEFVCVEPDLVEPSQVSVTGGCFGRGGTAMGLVLLGGLFLRRRS